jgi:phage-related protein
VAGKPLFWVGSSREDIREFPADARRKAGRQLRLVQEGFEPSDWKPMPAIGLGINEIRIHTALEHRILYIAKFAEGVYVLHVFEKRTRRTPPREIELAKHRLRDLMQWRREHDIRS